MGRFNYRTTLVTGSLVALVSLTTAWALGLEPGQTEPAPLDAMLEEAPEPADLPIGDPLDTPPAGAKDWDLPVTHNDRVAFWIEFLSGKNYDKTRLWLERTGRYGPMIRAKLRERGMPEDLLYLAMIESGLSPRAYSHAHASGMWQFISETGRRYGLEVNGWTDERRDPEKATEAALDYLSELYDRFGSWYLAAASYNTGENRVGRIMRETFGRERGKDAEFWRIDGRLPRETRDYVPLMLAMGHIAKAPEKHGFRKLEYQTPLAYDHVSVPGGTAIGTIAKAAGVDEDDVADLNAHLVRGATPPGASTVVRIPAGRRLAFTYNFPKVRDEVRAATVTYRLRRGETLSHVARRYGVSVAQLRAANGHVNPRRLQVGQAITVPVSAGASSQVAAQTQWTTYRVRRGDTLWDIARKHGVSVRELQRWNGVGSRIQPGQRLRIRA